MRRARARRENAPHPRRLRHDPQVDTETGRGTLAAARARRCRRRAGRTGGQEAVELRYDLSNRPAAGVAMSRGKPVQDGVRVRLPSGTSWDQLAAMSADEIREKGVFPAGFLPLPHPNHAEGGMLFPQFHIDEIKR